MRVTVSERAEKQLRKVSKLKQLIITSKLMSLDGGEKLKGYKDMYRTRVGDYRIVYRRLDDEVHVVLIGHRKDVYKLLVQLLG